MVSARFAVKRGMRGALAGACLGAAATLALPAPAAAQDLGEPIPYSAILAAPNDLELNFRYARQQIAAGRLPAAAATLERLLIVQPDWHQVRLLYGVVLYRLGQTAEARGEFAVIPPEALSDGDRAVLAEYQTLAAREEQEITGSLGITLGSHYDTNRNNFPLDGRFRIDLPGVGDTIIIGQDDENADIGLYALIDGRVDFDTGQQRLSRVSIEAAGLVDNQIEEDDLDAISGLIGLGALYDADVVDLKPRLIYRRIGLGGEQYLSSGEARLRAERRIGTDGRLKAFAEVSGGIEDFSGVDADPFASESDGPFFGAGIGVSYVPVDDLRLSARYAFTLKDADESFESFDAHGIQLAAEYVVAPGMSLSAIGGYTRQNFDAPDPFISSTIVQEDDEIFGGIGALISADAVLGAVGVTDVGPVADNLVLNISGDYRHVSSTLENFEYDNFRFNISLTKRFYF